MTSAGTLRATADLAPAPRWTRTGRGLEAPVRPLWAGVRPYADEADPTRTVREFRDPAQFTPEYLRLWERLAAAPGHPVTADGKLVFLDADAPPEGRPHPADPEHATLFPHSAYQCGATGDSIAMVPGEHGELVPELMITIHDGKVADLIVPPKGGPRRDQVSPGFLRFVIDGPGVWRAPDGTEHPYDREQVVNPADPRVPPPLRPFIGPNYVGVAFDGRTGWTRGRGVARIGVDGIVVAPDAPVPGDMPEETAAPRLFTLTRVADESGVSGTGLVLRGVIWPEGQVTVCWCAAAGPVPVDENIPQSYLTWGHFSAIHVGQHPPEQSVIEFLDGQPPPTAAPAAQPTNPEPEAPVQPQPTNPVPPNPPAQPTPDAAPSGPAADMAKLTAENAMLKQRVQELEAALAAAQSAKTAADGFLATLRAQADGLLAEVKPHREAARAAEVERVALVTGVDGVALAAATEKTKGDDGKEVEVPVPAARLPVAAMRLRLTADGFTVPQGVDEAAYLRARFDLLAEQQGAPQPAPPSGRATPDGPSPAFRESVSGSSSTAPNSGRREPAKRDASFSELD